MNEAKTYKTAGAFRTALEARLQARGTGHTTIGYEREQVTSVGVGNPVT
jgi:hypothetical protein